MAEPLWCQTSQEGMKSQFISSRGMETWIAALSIQLHICSIGAKALTISTTSPLAVAISKLLSALFVKESLAKLPLQGLCKGT